MNNYRIVVMPAMDEITIKKSRFIANAFAVNSRADCLTQVARIQSQFSDARHHCWAYVVGDPMAARNAGMCDDGEPSGTAGKPILNVLQHSGVGDVAIVVTRYFGGVKLGAGWLSRAYSAAAQAVMDVLQTRQCVPVLQLTVGLDYAQEATLRHSVQQHQGTVLSVNYEAHGLSDMAGKPYAMVAMIEIPSVESDAFHTNVMAHQMALMDSSSDSY